MMINENFLPRGYFPPKNLIYFAVIVRNDTYNAIIACHIIWIVYNLKGHLFRKLDCVWHVYELVKYWWIINIYIGLNLLSEWNIYKFKLRNLMT